MANWTVDADSSGAQWRTTSAQYISAPSGLFYGAASGGYDVGTTHGSLTSPAVALPAGVASERLQVSLWRNLLVEPISSRDRVTLEVIDAAGDATLIWDKSFDNGPGLSWRLDTVSLPAGLSGEVRFRFNFDTLDAIDNDGQGVFIDDLSVRAPCP